MSVEAPNQNRRITRRELIVGGGGLVTVAGAYAGLSWRLLKRMGN